MDAAWRRAHRRPDYVATQFDDGRYTHLPGMCTGAQPQRKPPFSVPYRPITAKDLPPAIVCDDCGDPITNTGETA